MASQKVTLTALFRKNAGRWSNGKSMWVGDWYELHLDKPRVLSEVTFRSEGQRFPKRVKFLIKATRNDNQWRLETEAVIDVKQHDEATIFRYRFDKHQKVESMKLEIVEPTSEPRNIEGHSPAWAIYGVDVKEYRLFGCLWESPIN